MLRYENWTAAGAEAVAGIDHTECSSPSRRNGASTQAGNAPKHAEEVGTFIVREECPRKQGEDFAKNRGIAF